MTPSSRPQLVIALDVPSRSEALSLARILSGNVTWLKIGLRLFISAGPHLVRELSEKGFKIFLDLKFYDIPNTVAAAVREVCRLGVDMLTIHAQGGGKMCVKALEAAAAFPNPPIVCAVTALTSFARGEMPGIALPPSIFAAELATLAHGWGIPAIVCSAMEVMDIKKSFPDLLCVCPGIRPANCGNADQKRVATPRSAVQAGADFLVVGRPVIEAENPVQAASAILQEMRESEKDFSCL